MWPAQRPISVTIFTVLVFIGAVSSAIRCGAAIAFWETLETYHAQPGALYIAASGAFWCLAGMPLTVGIFLGFAWARKASLILVPGYAVWYWFDRLYLQTWHPNWAFALVITASLLSFSFITLFLEGNIQYFTSRERHDQESEN